MPRYKRGYRGEKRTAQVKLNLTPSELATLEKAAARKKESLSQHARELCLRKMTGARVVADTTRDPDRHAVVRELQAIGNNLNQIARFCNTDKTAPQREELQATAQLIRAAIQQGLMP